MKAHTATITVVIDADGQAFAMDVLSELLVGDAGIVDWGYIRNPDGTYSEPEPIEIPDDYDEGEFYAIMDKAKS